MKKILGLSIATLLIIALVVGGTLAFFSDTETSEASILTTGTIDLAVNTLNPWTYSFTEVLTGLKPGVPVDTVLTLTNVGTGPMDVWMRITGVSTSGGAFTYWGDAVLGASSEPEYVLGGGGFDVNGVPTGVGYVETKDIDTIVSIALESGPTSAPVVIAYDSLFVDDANGFWIYLGTLGLGVSEEWPAGSLGFSMGSVDTATEAWAHGDTMTFTVEFYAQQTEGTPAAPETELTDYERPVTP